MASSSSSSPPSTLSFLSPIPYSSRYVRPSIPVHKQPLPIIKSSPTSNSLTLLHLEATPYEYDLPLGAPIIVLVAVILAFSAQSWINSLLGGDQGLGAFLSDGTGFSKSGFKQRSAMADRDDTTKPLGGPDPLPWLKLPQLDYVDVAGQPPKIPKQMQQQPTTERAASLAIDRDDSKVISKLESLREQMKTEVEQNNMEGADQIKRELMRVMKEEGYDFSA